ncbi:mucin-1-like [Nycticebus coucang]|uniref:mucin-1-like n=1 Tax=Nycticebus coucang TaxID=9470 RepID=UPI00234CA92C|nr:mucin-1-like [Nycticebus coucang]XP_053414503.1 mucin-1-like [Nycticebus coucang]
MWKSACLHTRARSLPDTHVHAWHTCTHAHKHACSRLCTAYGARGPVEMGTQDDTRGASPAPAAGADRRVRSGSRGWVCPRWGLSRRPAAEETEGEGGAAREQRGRPLSAVRGGAPSSPPSATAAPRQPPGPGAPRGPQETSSEAWRPAPGGGTGPGRQARGRGCRRRLPGPGALGRPCQEPAPARPRGCVTAGPSSLRPSPPGRRRLSTLRTQHIRSRVGAGRAPRAEPAPHFTDADTEAKRARSLEHGKGPGGLHSSTGPLPGPGSGGVRRDAEGHESPSLRPREGPRRQQAPFPGIGGGKVPALAPGAAPARGAACCSGSTPGLQALSSCASLPPPRSRRNKSENSYEDQRASQEGERWALRDPGRAPHPPPGTGRGRRAPGTDSAGCPHPLPGSQLLLGGGAPRNPSATPFPCLTLLGFSKPDLAAPRRAGRRVLLPLRVRKAKASLSTSFSASSAAWVAEQWNA